MSRAWFRVLLSSWYTGLVCGYRKISEWYGSSESSAVDAPVKGKVWQKWPWYGPGRTGLVAGYGCRSGMSVSWSHVHQSADHDLDQQGPVERELCQTIRSSASVRALQNVACRHGRMHYTITHHHSLNARSFHASAEKSAAGHQQAPAVQKAKHQIPAPPTIPTHQTQHPKPQPQASNMDA